MNLLKIFHAPHKAKMKRKTRRVALYDFTQNRNPDGGHKRTDPRIETGAEEDPNGGGLTPHNRLKGIAAARNAYRNDPRFRGLVRTLQNNVIGSEGKLRFYAAADGEQGNAYRAAETYFAKWAKKAAFRDGASFRNCMNSALAALLIDGDFVAVFDDGAITESGKLLFFEADQICNLNDADFSPYAAKGYTQKSGIILDTFGREVGVIVSSKRGQTSIPASEAFVLTKNPDSDEDANWILVKATARLNQTRGIADSLASMQYLADGYEALVAELQTAKLAASRYASISEPADETTGAPQGFDADETEGEEGEEEYSPDALLQYCGGNVDLIPNGAAITFDPAQRPNGNLATFLQSITDYAGQGFGLASSYTQQRAQGSYTSARFDSLISWRTFSALQQMVEDSFLDWVGRQVLRFAMAHGKIPELPQGWESEISWSFPRMQSLDELKDIQAASARLKNGLTNYAAELGPTWRESLAQLAAELDYCKAHGLPLNIFETVAGALTTESKTETEERELGNDEN